MVADPSELDAVGAPGLIANALPAHGALVRACNDRLVVFNVEHVHRADVNKRLRRGPCVGIVNHVLINDMFGVYQSTFEV